MPRGYFGAHWSTRIAETAVYVYVEILRWRSVPRDPCHEFRHCGVGSEAIEVRYSRVGLRRPIAVPTVLCSLTRTLGPTANLARVQFTEAMQAWSTRDDTDDMTAHGRWGGLREDAGRNIEIGRRGMYGDLV